MIDYVKYQGFKNPESDRTVLIAQSNGHMRTTSLFREIYKKDRYEPLYSMRDYEYKGYISAYQIYMNSIDETDAALKLVGSLRHWRVLCELDWFMNGSVEFGFDGLNQWREDMKARDISLAKSILLANTAAGDSPSAQKLINHANGTKKATTKPLSKKEEKGTKKLDQRSAKILELHQKINNE